MPTIPVINPQVMLIDTQAIHETITQCKALQDCVNKAASELKHAHQVRWQSTSAQRYRQRLAETATWVSETSGALECVIKDLKTFVDSVESAKESHAAVQAVGSVVNGAVDGLTSVMGLRR